MVKRCFRLVTGEEELVGDMGIADVGEACDVGRGVLEQVSWS